MRTFGELLTEYMQRTGISDSELARTLGVRRQTIFRWKEGLVARPRSREDVLHCAQRLRLSPAERDELLISAGFAPVEPPTDDGGRTTEKHALPLVDMPPASVASAQEPISSTVIVEPVTAPPVFGQPANLEPISPSSSVVLPSSVTTPRPSLLVPHLSVLRRSSSVLFAAALIVLAFVTFLILRNQPTFQNSNPPVAAPGETLILMSPISAVTPGQPGFDVTGRIQAALEREMRAARIEVRVARAGNGIGDTKTAADILRRSGATLVIWGNQNNGVGTVHLLSVAPTGIITSPSSSRVTLPEEIQLTIDSALLEEVHDLSLIAVARVWIQRGNDDAAEAAIVQALAQPPSSKDALDTIDLYRSYLDKMSRSEGETPTLQTSP